MTIAIIIITSAISILAFNNHNLFSKLQLNPYQTFHQKQWYRLLTHGFLHADWLHLIINMLVLYSFGTYIEDYFAHLKNAGYLNNPTLYYIFLYIGGVFISSLTTLKKHKDDPYYNSVGASGAVSAILFTSIFFAPWQKLLLYAVIPIPGILLGVAYLVYSQYMSKKGKDNVNHDAHFIGAIYGFLFPIIIDFRLVAHFIHSLTNF